MPFSSNEQIELHFQFASIFRQLDDILNNLFFMKLELEAGEIPVFPPEPIFDPMNSINPFVDGPNDLFFSDPELEGEVVLLFQGPPPSPEFDAMKTFGKYE